MLLEKEYNIVCRETFKNVFKVELQENIFKAIFVLKGESTQHT